MPLRDRGCLARLAEPLARVQPHRLEQPVAALTPALVRRHKRLLDEPSEHVGNLWHDEAVTGADLLDGGEPEAAGEDGEPAEQRPLVRLE